MKNTIENIIALLNPDNTISAHRLLAHAIGMTETVIYSALISKQAFYSKCNMLAEGGWFYSTIYDLQESTTYGVKAQTTAIRHLVEFGLIECITKGLPAKRYFRVLPAENKIKQLIEKGKEIVKKFSAHTKSSVPDKREETKISVDEGKLQFAPSAKTSFYPKAETCLPPANNKTKDIKPKIYKSDINQSFNRKSEASSDRLTEQKPKRYKFSEVLKMLGVDWQDLVSTEPKTENVLCDYDEDLRMTKKCSIPYFLKEDNRVYAAGVAGKKNIPAIVKENLPDDEAEVYVIETNVIQRGFKDLKISEQAFAIALRYKKLFDSNTMKAINEELLSLEGKGKLQSPVGTEQGKTDKMSRTAEEYGLGRNTVARLLRINELTDNLKKMIDEGGIKIRPAVELSFLSKELQEEIYAIIKKNGIETVDMKAAKQLRELSEGYSNPSRELLRDALLGKQEEQTVKAKTYKVAVSQAAYTRYFVDVPKKEINDIVEKALEMYFASQNV